MENQDRFLRVHELSRRLQYNLCLECGGGEDVSNGLCFSCQQLPHIQKLMAIEIAFEAKYYLVVGGEMHAKKLRDCHLSDQIELAEADAEEALRSFRTNGDLESMVRVVEAESGLVVYVAGRSN